MSDIDFDMFDVVCTAAKKLAFEKNKLYGVKNLLIFDGLGIIVRMNDKIARINNLFINRATNIDTNKLNESIDDSLLDLINYSIYLYLYSKDNLIKK